MALTATRRPVGRLETVFAVDRLPGYREARRHAVSPALRAQMSPRCPPVKGHGTKFGRKEEAAIAALLTQKNHEEAARVPDTASSRNDPDLRRRVWKTQVSSSISHRTK
jgi:hypothetical protein